DRLRLPFAVACDLSVDMLRLRPNSTPTLCSLAAAGEALPFASGAFDGLFTLNVLEHVADLDAMLQENARVLENNGLWFAVTPNGSLETWLDLAERWSLKLPEGPHTFLTPRDLRVRVGQWFDIVDHRTLLVVPAGPLVLTAFIDRLLCCHTWRGGFFQFIVAR